MHMKGEIMKKKIVALIVITSALSLAACGKKEIPAPPTVDVSAPAEDKEEPAAEETKEEPAEEKSANIDPEDVGKYMISEYTVEKTTLDLDALKASGMDKTYLELKEDGTGTLFLYDKAEPITWEKGVVTIFETSEYTYKRDGDTLVLNMQGPEYTMIREK